MSVEGYQIPRFYLAVLIPALVLVTTLSFADTNDVDLEFVINGIKYNDSLLENCSVKISYAIDITTYPEGNNTLRDWFNKTAEVSLPPFLNEVSKEHYEYDIALKGEKERIEEKYSKYSPSNEQDSTNLTLHRLWTYDGEKTRQIYYPQEEGAKSEGIISSGFLFSPYSPYNIPLVFADFLGQKMSLSNYPGIELVGETQIDNYECYLLEWSNKDSRTTVKIWVAPEFGFRALRIESHSNVFETIQKNDYEKYNGIWAIKHQISQGFLKKGQDSLRLFQRELTVKKAEFVIPPEEIPDSVFSLEFPKELEKIWDSDREILIDNPSLEKNEEDIPTPVQ